MFKLVSCLVFFLVCLGYVYGGNCPDSLIPIEDIQSAFQASKIIYQDNIQTGQLIPYTGFTITQIEMEYFYEGGEGIKALLAEKDYTTIVAFRGTDGPDQMKQQLYDYLKNHHGKKMTFGGTEVSVNAFFWNAFQLLYPGIKSKLQDQARKYILTGHSLGGAMASLLAIYAKDDEGRMWENPSSCLITFGQPRDGDGKFSKKHDEMINSYRKLRFVNGLDPVPHIPFWPWEKHHSREIWMSRLTWTRRKYWQVCKDKDPLGCSNLWTLVPNVRDHELARYESQIMTPPKLFYDKNSKKHDKWLNAVRSSCSSRKKRH